MNILYIGSSGALSLIPFKKLLCSKYSIAAVAVNKPVLFDNKIIALENESLALAANQYDIPLIDLSADISVVLQQCKKFSVDTILMSCYNKRLPDTLINVASKGCFNLHPSLLPAYRGPEPVFWQMKEASDMGVSWHRVVHDFDAGDIVKQKKVKLDEGATYTEINHQLADAGAELMMDLLNEISTDLLTSTVQDSSLASYYPYPEQGDFVVETSWTAQRAYDFMRATKSFGYPYLYRSGKQQYLLEQALDYDNNAHLDEIEVKADTLYIPFNEGILCATYTGKLHA